MKVSSMLTLDQCSLGHGNHLLTFGEVMLQLVREAIPRLRAGLCPKRIWPLRSLGSWGRLISSKARGCVLTNLLSRYAVLGYKKLGIVYNKEDMEALVHFWRVIGYMIGIQDR